MRVLFVTSGLSTIHAALDDYIWDAFTQIEVPSSRFPWLSRSHPLESLFTREQIPVDRVIIGEIVGDLLIAECARFRPDWVLVHHGGNLLLSTLGTLHSMGIRTAVWVVDDPYEILGHLQFAEGYDHVFTVERWAIKSYEELGVPATQLSLGAHPTLFQPLNMPRSWSWSFVGSGFPSRIAFFRQYAPHLLQYPGLISGQWWRPLPPSLHPIVNEGMATPFEVGAIYNGSGTNLNLHRRAHDPSFFKGSLDGSEIFSPNNRTFEIASTAGFQMASKVTDAEQYYAADEVIWFEDEEFPDLIRYWSHPDREHERRRVAERSHERTLRCHTYVHRVTTILEVLSHA